MGTGKSKLSKLKPIDMILQARSQVLSVLNYCFWLTLVVATQLHVGLCFQVAWLFSSQTKLTGPPSSGKGIVRNKVAKFWVA